MCAFDATSEHVLIGASFLLRGAAFGPQKPGLCFLLNTRRKTKEGAPALGMQAQIMVVWVESMTCAHFQHLTGSVLCSERVPWHRGWTPVLA